MAAIREVAPLPRSKMLHACRSGSSTLRQRQVVMTEPWIVERIFGGSGAGAELAKDFENLARSHRHSSSCGN